MVIFIIAILATVLLVFIKKSKVKSGYIFEEAKISSITEIVSESGVVISDGNTEIFSPTNGVIVEIYVENGETVKSGQKLFKVESSATEEEKQSAKANYLSAKSTLDIDSSNLFKLQSAMFTAWDKHYNLAIDSKYQNEDKSPNYINRALPEYATVNADWLASETAYKSQLGVIAKDKVALSSAYIKYLSTQTSVVTSPLPGIIDNIGFSKGKSVEIKDQISNTTKPILIIKNSNDLETIITVGQTNISKVKEGQSVIVIPDAYKDKRYSGTILRVDNIGQNKEGVVTYNVYAKIESDELVRAGMTFDSEITTNSLDSVLSVPNSAIVLDKGAKTVRVFENNTIKNISVEVGIKGETRTQIISGLSEGQEIIVSLTNEKAARPGFLGL